jgi:hypothetical protein
MIRIAVPTPFKHSKAFAKRWKKVCERKGFNALRDVDREVKTRLSRLREGG